MKKAHLTPIVVLVIIAVVASFILYKLHTTKKPYQVTISDGKNIVGDGAGSYICGNIQPWAEVRFNDESISTALDYGERFVLVIFPDAKWKDENLNDSCSRLPVKRCHIVSSFGFYDSKVSDVKVGEHLEIDWVYLYFRDVGETRVFPDTISLRK